MLGGNAHAETVNVRHLQCAQRALVTRHKNELALGRRRKDLGFSGIDCWDRRQLIEPEITRLHRYGHRFSNRNEGIASVLAKDLS